MDLENPVEEQWAETLTLQVELFFIEQKLEMPDYISEILDRLTDYEHIVHTAIDNMEKNK